jgi:tetratricopeptide (TPR) repeat protein
MMELAIKLNPERSYYLRTAAQNYVKLGKEAKALKIFGPEFAAEHQDDAMELNTYAWFWAGQGINLESALEAAKKSIELQEAYYNWDTLATVHQKLKNHEEALEAAEKAYELADEQIKTRYKAKLEQIKKAVEKEEEKK